MIGLRRISKVDMYLSQINVQVLERLNISYLMDMSMSCFQIITKAGYAIRLSAVVEGEFYARLKTRQLSCFNLGK